MSVAVAVKDDLAREVRAVAEQEGLPLEEFVERALLHTLTQINRQKLRAETEAFQAMRADLEARYPEQFVAVHQGKVVDHGPLRRDLYLRIRQKYGTVAVLIKQVTREGERELTFLSPWSLERDSA